MQCVSTGESNRLHIFSFSLKIRHMPITLRTLLTSAAIALIASSPATAFHFVLSSPAPDVFRIEIQPGVTTTSDVHSITSDTTRLLERHA